MKKRYLTKIILASLTITMLLNLNSVAAYAAWQKDSQNNWNWLENDTKATGWKDINSSWYHFNINGVMNTGWLKDNDGRWYYLASSGEMQREWFKDKDNKWYHLSRSGAMDIGWLKDTDNKWYYLSNSGVMLTGWLKDKNQKWYYLSNDGSMDIGWLEDKGNIYYLDSSGEMVTGKLTIDGDVYTFSENGQLLSKEISNSIESDETSSDEIRKGYVITESSPLNVREEPSALSNILGIVPKKSKVKVIGKEVNGFYKISYNDLTGWSSSEWIKLISDDDEIVDEDLNEDNKEDLDGGLNVELGEERTAAPALDNKYYYSNNNIFYKVKLSPPFLKDDGSPIVGNCTWYAWGRIWELTGQAPVDAKFLGNGYEWWQSNLNTGKYKTGNEPRVGALAVWKPSLAGSGGFGHVAVIEKIEKGKVYISESSWHGSLFKYRELYNTQDLYGYIYLDEPNY
ncbi:CHAP domain-containing protein [Clostridium botulinum]|uniref:N-acetylmuramoyl-L-alanine amidase n=1 Tax=Clostridium botulinum TaxID=1491 RepID=A0A0L9Y4V9_CLOBO|nr:CHAP domain-containing protein [Clostridium botulinum]ACD52078.1 surface protective antigen SpaB [Clostridium botulinum E3 str. Alaska E43]AJF29964.1 ligand-binding protein SH3 [Clostridium botulinum]AJF33027.1 ligand-binding protein SH3 [Clostridium botulinum]KAI3345235.1 CHAP domain-containing protein [Clostridium botulinum]KOM86830.1 ligand-binding protein SH3 [Clostridium botulinum]